MIALHSVEVEKKRQPVARDENVPRVRRARNRMVNRHEEG